MKKRITYIVIIILLSLSTMTKAQNLVYNGSFEERQTVCDYFGRPYNCPFSSDHINDPMLTIAEDWSNPNGDYSYNYTGSTYTIYSSSDYFHSCGNDSNNIPSWSGGTISHVSVPYADYVIKYQYPRTGNGYGGGGFQAQIQCTSIIRTLNIYKLN